MFLYTNTKALNLPWGREQCAHTGVISLETKKNERKKLFEITNLPLPIPPHPTKSPSLHLIHSDASKTPFGP